MRPVQSSLSAASRDTTVSGCVRHSTAAKHGISVITAIRDALAGDRWMPPRPRTPVTPPAGTRTQAITPPSALSSTIS